MGKKYFTDDEVNQLIPQLEYHFKKLLIDKKEMAKLSLRLKKMGITPRLLEEHSSDSRPEAKELHRQLQKSYQDFKQHILAIENLGGEIKDFELGRVDFHSLEGNQEVLLIWQLGVTEMAHRHFAENTSVSSSALSATPLAS